MLLVIASGFDTTAPPLVAGWAQHGAVLLTCQDLSVAGWQWHPGDPDRSTFVAGGQQIPVSELRGVLTRLPAVFEQELQHIVAADRAYVAAEMTAFLRSWLADLPCPVLNRPTPTGLSGPSWRTAHWVATAARLGLTVEPVRRRTTAPGRLGSAPGDPQPATPPEAAVAAGPITGTVVGGRCFGALPEAVKTQARCLADAAGVDLLGVHFLLAEEEARFAGATLWPELNDPEVAEAVASYLCNAPASTRSHP
jgi:hypothetical protein